MCLMSRKLEASFQIVHFDPFGAFNRSEHTSHNLQFLNYPNYIFCISCVFKLTYKIIKDVDLNKRDYGGE